MSYLQISNRNRAKTAVDYKTGNSYSSQYKAGLITRRLQPPPPGSAQDRLPLTHFGWKSRLKAAQPLQGSTTEEAVKLLAKQRALKRSSPSPGPSRSGKLDSRPRTSAGATKNVHFSDVVDRFRPGEPASQILLSKRREATTTALPSSRGAAATVEENKRYCDPKCFNLMEGHHVWHPANGNNPQEADKEAVIMRRSGGSLGGEQGVKECNSDECDLEFMNASFVYGDEDDDLSVNEFSLDDATVVKKRKSCTGIPRANKSRLVKSKLDECYDDDFHDSSQSTTLAGLMKSLFPLGGSIFGTSNAADNEPSILSTVTTAGGRIIRGVAQAIFCDSYHQERPKSVFKYNDYSITTCGNDLSLNSVFLGGGENQRVRIFVETKEDEGVGGVSGSGGVGVPKTTLNVSVTASCWALSSRDRKGRVVGSIEIRGPTAVPLTKVSVQGPFQGLLCINVP